MTPERAERFKEIIKKRQGNLTIILENVHDPHNIGAVLRSCDSVGIREIYVLYTDPQLINEERVELGQNSSSGARRWVQVQFFTDTAACFNMVRSRYQTILGTHLSKEAKSLYQLDLTQSVALLFGNEKDGISPQSLAHVDGNFIIPQVGLVKSLNISVACAVTLYEAHRQRDLKGYYTNNPTITELEQEQLFQRYAHIHENKMKMKSVERINPSEES